MQPAGPPCFVCFAAFNEHHLIDDLTAASAMPLPYPHSADANRDACRFMAIEGQLYVLVATQVMTPAGAEILGMDWKAGGFPLPGGGFSTIFDPHGEHLTEKIDPGTEAILYAEASLEMVDRAKGDFMTSQLV